MWKCCKHKKTKGPPPQDGLEEALNALTVRGNNHISCWMWWIFLLCASPGILNAWHLTSFVFIAYKQSYWCKIPQLENAGWTPDQIHQISVSKENAEFSCVAYNWDYANMTRMNMTFEVAKAECDSKLAAGENPGEYKCTDYHFEGSGVISQWQLMCSTEKDALRSTVQSAVAIGKLSGALIFGVVADKFGRKRSYVLSNLLYIVSAMVSCFTKNYWVFVVMRIGTGMAGAGTFNVAFTLMTEICQPEHRMILGNLYNLWYPFAMVLLSAIAYLLRNYHWQMLQLALSAPTFILLLYCWWIPESPRWLISQRRRDEAWDVVRSASRGKVVPPPSQGTYEADDGEKKPCRQRCRESCFELESLLFKGEMRIRLFLCHFVWFASALTYFSLSLNNENFGLNRFWYIALLAGVETISYIMPILILKFIGRRLCCAIFLFFTAFTLITIIALPQASVGVVTLAMLGGVTVSSVYSVIILYTTELFPTENRNTAVGTSSMVSHIGGGLAPYVTGMLGDIKWYIPSSLCGALALSAGFLVLLLPETKDKVLEDTVEQVMAEEKNRVAIRNCWGLNK